MLYFFTLKIVILFRTLLKIHFRVDFILSLDVSPGRAYVFDYHRFDYFKERIFESLHI